MKCIIGIGNPGKQYEKTRHNVGFCVLDALSECRKKVLTRWAPNDKLKSLVAHEDETLFLIKPQTFVNLTGEAVNAFVKRYTLTPRDILVVSDDANLDFGKIRIRAEGSDGGHHGLASVILALGSDQFPRLRVGIRNAAMPKVLVDFVLGQFDPEEKKSLQGIIQRAATACGCWADSGYKAAVEFLSKSE